MVTDKINDPIKQLEDCIEFLRTPREERKRIQDRKKRELKKKAKTNPKKEYNSFMKVASFFLFVFIFYSFTCF